MFHISLEQNLADVGETQCAHVPDNLHRRKDGFRKEKELSYSCSVRELGLDSILLAASSVLINNLHSFEIFLGYIVFQ